MYRLQFNVFFHDSFFEVAQFLSFFTAGLFWIISHFLLYVIGIFSMPSLKFTCFLLFLHAIILHMYMYFYISKKPTTHDLVSSPDEMDTIYLDFHKTFDCVPHNKLLFRLWSVGITDSLYMALVCLLSKRQIPAVCSSIVSIQISNQLSLGTVF